MSRLAFVALTLAAGLGIAAGCSSSQLGGGAMGGNGGSTNGTGGINTRAEGGSSGGSSSGGTGGTATGGTAGTTSSDAGRDAPADGGRTCRAAGPCPFGWYWYSDHLCGPPRPDGGSGCSPVGDGLCYQPCTSSADCTDPHTPNCTALYIFNGSDVAHPMTVCTSTPALPACTSADAGQRG